MNKDRDRVLAYLSAYPSAIIDDIWSVMRGSNADITNEVEEYRNRTGGGPPLLAYLDLPSSVSPLDVRDLMCGTTYVLHNAFKSPAWSDDHYAQVIADATGTNSELAREIASREVSTPDTNLRALEWKVLAQIPSIPMIPSDEAAHGVLSIATDAITGMMAMTGSDNKSNDMLYEFMRLGAAIRKLTKRATLSAKEKQIEVGGASVAKWTDKSTEAVVSLGQQLLALLPLLIAIFGRRAKIGDPVEAAETETHRRSAVADYRAKLYALAKAQPSPYESYARNNPESGDWTTAMARFAPLAALTPMGMVAGLAAPELAKYASRQKRATPGKGRRTLRRISRDTEGAGPRDADELVSMSEEYSDEDDGG